MCDREYHLTEAEIGAADARPIPTGRGNSGRKRREAKPPSIDPETMRLELIGHKTDATTAPFQPTKLTRRFD